MVKTLEVVNSLDNSNLVNFAKLDGYVLQKNDSLLSRKLASKKGQCCFYCVEEVACLSVNVILQSDSSYMCELFNWTATKGSNRLVSKKNSYFSARKVIAFL